MYGDIIGADTSDQTDLVRSVQCYQKSLAATTGSRGWERQEETCVQLIAVCRTLMAAVARVTGAQHLQLASSIRMSVSSAAKLVQQGQTSVQTGLVQEGVRDQLELLTSELALFTDNIAKLREG